ncbi:MAG TPA: HRDC domain-containing protein, partial [Desulfobacterales bacterium]|nr:HRDC domain-containing protein [Desulfobacterales bacterium]
LLFERLRQLRLEISKELGVPPYVVFHDKTLKEMAARRPSTRAELLQVSGVGERKAEQYGERFLDAIQSGS